METPDNISSFGSENNMKVKYTFATLMWQIITWKLIGKDSTNRLPISFHEYIKLLTKSTRLEHTKQLSLSRNRISKLKNQIVMEKTTSRIDKTLNCFTSKNKTQIGLYTHKNLYI